MQASSMDTMAAPSFWAPGDAPARAAGLSLKAAGWDKGIPTVHLRSQPPPQTSKRPATAEHVHQPPVKKKVQLFKPLLRNGTGDDQYIDCK